MMLIIEIIMQALDKLLDSTMGIDEYIGEYETDSDEENPRYYDEHSA